MTKIIDQNTVSVAIVENNAYWVHNNTIYKAPIEGNGRIETESAKKVDVFSLSDKETKKLLSILDLIKER